MEKVAYREEPKNVKFVHTIDEEQFNTFVENHENGSLLQTAHWGKFKSTYGWSMELVGLVNSQNVLIAASMFLRRKIPMTNKSILYAPRGYVLDYNDSYILSTFTKHVKEYAKSTSTILVKIDPTIRLLERNLDGEIIETGFNNEWLVNDLKDLGYLYKGAGIQPKFVFVLDISKDLKTLQKSFHHKTRYNIKLAQKKGVEIFEGTKEDLVHFDRLMQITGTRNNFTTRPFSYFERMYHHLEKDGKLKLFFTRYNVEKALSNCEKAYKKELENEQPDERRIEKLKKEIDEANQLLKSGKKSIILSAAILTITGDKACYLYGASDNLYRNLMPTYLMQWTMIQYAKEQGCTSYDFGGISGALDPDSPDYGVYRFKKGFNGEIFEYIGEFELVTNKLYYFLWEKLVKIRKC